MRPRHAARAALLLTALAACGDRAAPAAPAAPRNTPGDHAAAGADRDPLLSAERIELNDVWVGLGCSHEFTATLTPHGAVFTGEGALAIGYQRDAKATKPVSVPRATIAALQTAMAAAHAAMAQAEPTDRTMVSSWTDDYPSGSMTFTGPAGVHRLEFTEQHRMLQWVHDGKTEPLDRPQDIFDGKSSAIWDAYSAVLDAAGLRPWIDQACGRD
ncbi:MAG: hypothetical protein JNK64_16080 [Myxococcales bacterium]|nr:hypothetical protein [Myxococcales bacterium]